MESKNRTAWIAVAAFIVVACCCMVAIVVATVVPWGIRSARYGSFELGGSTRERVERSFEVGNAPTLDVTNFAGEITVSAGDRNEIQVTATKKAPGQNRLEQIEVSVTGQGDSVVVSTRKLRTLNNASVTLDIVAPPGTRVKVDAGAGTVAVRGIAGQVEIHSGAGAIHILDASGPVRVEVGAGEVTYEGRPAGDCGFQTGVGTISLRLPPDLGAELDLGTGLGAVDVSFEVAGRVSIREVQGTIGDGSEASIRAHTGVGAISVKRW